MGDLRHVRAADLVRVPWKNGGGTTADVAVHPAGAGFDTFGWRISMADVAADGPFSRFPGVDRTLVLAEGRDLVLDIDGTTRRLAAPGDAIAFAGEAATAGLLRGGPIRDLNVMTRRGRFTHRVATVEDALDSSWGSFATFAVAAIFGAVEVAVEGRAITLDRLDVLLVAGGIRDATVAGPAVGIGFAPV